MADILDSYFNKRTTKNKEKVLSCFFKKKYCYFVREGRTSLFLALKDIELKENDEIIVPSYICDIVPKVASLFGKVVYADIDPKTFVVDYEDLKRKITRNTKVVIAAYLYGNAHNIKNIKKLCYKNKIILIEDCAQSIYSFDKKIRAGSVGDYSFFSFRFSKDINLFKGGALMTNKKINIPLKKSSSLKALILIIMMFFILKAQKIFYGRSYHYLKMHFLVPYFKKTNFNSAKAIESMSDFEKELIIKTMKKMPVIVEKRNSNAVRYTKCLKDIKKIQLCDYSNSSMLRFNILTKRRDELIKFLQKKGVEAGNMLYESLGNNCKKAKWASKNIVNIPVHHNLKDEDIEKICLLIQNFFRLHAPHN